MYILLIKIINERCHFLLDVKYEPSIIKNKIFVPTFSHLKIKKNKKTLDNLIKRFDGKIVHRSIQSEEGGRFYLAQNEYVILKIPDNKTIDKKFKKVWLPISQILILIRTTNFIGIQLRTFFSLINFLKK